MARTTTVRYDGPFDELEIPIPESDREPDEPRCIYVKRGDTFQISDEHAKALTEQDGFELVPKKKGD